jgi:hypothetical protein
MKLPEDGPKYWLKHVPVIKYNQYKQLDWFIFHCCVDGQNTTDLYYTVMITVPSLETCLQHTMGIKTVILEILLNMQDYSS